jgi:hypothetical protein
MKGEIMMIHACFMAVLMGASIGGAAAPSSSDPGLLVVTNEALVDVEPLCVVLPIPQMSQVERVIDANDLKSRIEAKLDDADIKHVEYRARPGARLVVHIEGLAVGGSDKYVYRVQTSLNRLVSLAGRPNPQIQAEVWQARPEMQVVAMVEAAEAMTTAALTQAETFIAARKTARASLAETGSTAQESSIPAPAGPPNPQAVSKYPFVASRSSSVFHRSDCRWAQNIADNNLVGYRTREEALQAGKRPCKTCKP